MANQSPNQACGIAEHRGSYVGPLGVGYHEKVKVSCRLQDFFEGNKPTRAEPLEKGDLRFDYSNSTVRRVYAPKRVIFGAVGRILKSPVVEFGFAGIYTNAQASIFCDFAFKRACKIIH